MDDPRPEVRCLVGFRFPDGDVWMSGALYSLDEAAQASAAGFTVLLDPQDESNLARWMQINAHRQPWQTW